MCWKESRKVREANHCNHGILNANADAKLEKVQRWVMTVVR